MPVNKNDGQYNTTDNIKRYKLGIDGGGTKTKICAARMDGEIFAQFDAGPFNLNGQKKEMVEETFLEIGRGLATRSCLPCMCAGIGIGTAGISNPEASLFVKEQLAALGFSCPVKLFGDHQTALAAAFESCEGIILISGTGSVCYGIYGGRMARAGGWGHLIDDKGSGYAIAADMLSAIVRSLDGRGGETALKPIVYDELGVADICGLIEYLYHPGRSKKELAALAALISRASGQGDTAALEIEERAAKDLYELADAVLRQLPCAQSVAFSGSVLMKNERIRNRLKNALLRTYPYLEICETEQNAAIGALRLLDKREKK